MQPWVHVIVAAGRSSRMGVPKARLNLTGKPQLDVFLELGNRLGADRQVVVVGVHESRIPQSVLERYGAETVRNPDPDSGQSDSMQRALDVLGTSNPVLMQPVDQVPLTPGSYRDLLEPSDDRIRIPTHRGQRGHPPLFPDWFLPEVEQLPEDRGIRSLYDRFSDRIREIELDDPAVLTDLDTPERLADARRLVRSRRNPGSSR